MKIAMNSILVLALAIAPMAAQAQSSRVSNIMNLTAEQRIQRAGETIQKITVARTSLSNLRAHLAEVQREAGGQVAEVAVGGAVLVMTGAAIYAIATDRFKLRPMRQADRLANTLILAGTTILGGSMIADGVGQVRLSIQQIESLRRQISDTEDELAALERDLTALVRQRN